MTSRFERIVTITEPAKMPASATPIGQAHGEHGPEGDHEDDDGERQAEGLGGGLLELAEGRAAELDLQAVDRSGTISLERATDRRRPPPSRHPGSRGRRRRSGRRSRHCDGDLPGPLLRRRGSRR